MTGLMHGFGCWFDVQFIGEQSTITLSTDPSSPGTHWYQCRLLLKKPMAVNETQMIHGNLKFIANERYSYDIHILLQLEGTSISSENIVHLHDQVFSYNAWNTTT